MFRPRRLRVLREVGIDFGCGRNINFIAKKVDLINKMSVFMFCYFHCEMGSISSFESEECL